MIRQLLVMIFTPFFLFAMSAHDIALESFRVNHSYYVKNMLIAKQKRKTIVAIKRAHEGKAKITKIERFLHNVYKDGIEAKDLIIIRSGKLSGLGILMTSYLDPKRSHEYLMWMPALRKVRRMAEPSEDAGLAAADIAFLEDAKLRRFSEEHYEIIKTTTMDILLKQMHFKKGELRRIRYIVPYKKETILKNKKIHIIKSTYTSAGHWYDYRLSYIDATHFTDYLTEYYKNDTLIKKVYRHWIKLKGIESEKAYMWYYWYSQDIQSGYEMINYIPTSLIKTNKSKPSSFWSTRTLRKLKR